MAQFDEIMSQVPVGQLASRFGVDESEVSVAVQQALPALLGGLHANAQDPSGADSIVSALSGHTAPVENLDDVDESDGRAIAHNIFGDQHDQVVQQLGGLGGVSGSLVSKLLPVLAPIVMSWLASKMGGGVRGSSGGLGGILGGVLGGGGTTAGTTTTQAETGALFPGGVGANSAPTQNPMDGSDAPANPGNTSQAGGAGGSLQDLLGSVLGGGASSGGGGSDILGGLLGGLLGGGKR